jgi:glutaredoxin
VKLYDIEYTFDREVKPEIMDGSLEGEFEEEQDMMEHVDTHLQLGCDNFETAVDEAIAMLDETFGDDIYNIVAIQEVAGVDILNWPGEGEPCNCPYCKAERMADEDVMCFACPYCGKEIRVAHGDWEAIPCIECGETILHDNIVDLGRNKYKAIKIQERKE